LSFLFTKLFILRYCKLPIKQKSKKTEKTVLFIKKPVDESLYEEFFINKISGFPFRYKKTAQKELNAPKEDKNK
tara:strand:+ start:951 stop:1172 length:222 start_codon:yes stop_codon:yes gene_type:complete